MLTVRCLHFLGVSRFPPKQSPICTLKLPWEVEGALRMLEVVDPESQVIVVGLLGSHGTVLCVLIHVVFHAFG